MSSGVATISVLWGRGCRGTSFAPDDPAGPAERVILVHLMTTKMIAKRTTATTMGTTTAATLPFSAEMTINKAK